MKGAVRPPAQGSPAVNWLYAIPALALMALVNVVPIGQSFFYARGWGRLASDTRLWIVLKNTFSFTFATVSLELILGLGIALLLTKPFRGRGLVRASVLIPWALPTAVMAMAWRWIFNSDYGVLGDLLYKLHLAASPRIPWLASSGPAFFACVLADVWKTTPFMAILLMSGLAAIPKELYEAAGIDGAGPVRQFFLITLPLLKPTIGLAVLFRAIQTFGVFDLIWVLTGGGPGGRTQTIALYVYDTVFRYQELGYGCALTLVMASCLLGMAAILLGHKAPLGMKESRASRIILGLGTAAVVAWSLAPFLWQLITSLKSPAEVLAIPPTYWPHTFSVLSYARIFTTRPFATYMANSFIVALGTTVLCTALGTLAAYAFARLKLPGGRWAVSAILLVALFPCTMLVVPLKQLIQAAGLLNSRLALILSYSALNLPFSIWVLMTFFKQVPMDIEEAAQVDGFSRWGLLWKIVFPLSAPAVATTAILIFIFSWNEFLLAMTFISRDAIRTVPVGIALLSGVTVYEVPWDQISAAVVVTTLPVVAMVLAFQRRIIEGLTAGAVKG